MMELRPGEVIFYFSIALLKNNNFRTNFTISESICSARRKIISFTGQSTHIFIHNNSPT